MTMRTLTSLAFMMMAAVVPPKAAPAADTGRTAHDFSFTSITGEPLPLSRFAGQAVMVVNTASRCGFTPQYEGLQSLYERYRDKGFVVLGVPSNDFGNQEPGDEAQIQEFCETTFNISFPMTEKQPVTGAQAHPLYKWLAEALGPAAKPNWNFHKILIGPDGRPLDAFPTTTKPTAAKVERAVEAALPAEPAT
jgi:glutathione peroxidase